MKQDRFGRKRYQKQNAARENMSGDLEKPSTGTPPTHPAASQGQEGFWVDEEGAVLGVSASDLERYTYCPMSWYLAATGHAGKSTEIEEGKKRHQAIHESIEAFQLHQFRTRRNLLIWQWWFGIIVILTIDTLAFQNIDSVDFNTAEFSKVLAMGALSCLVVGIGAVFIPWRSWLGVRPWYANNMADDAEKTLVDPVFEPVNFKGGWLEGGWIEAAMFISAIVLSLHAIALRFAINKEQAAYVLAVTTIGWMLLASFRLQRALISNNEAQILATKNNLSMDTTVQYSDDEKTASLLIDPASGLRGRPDQIVIIDSEFIPVEQKTGKVPAKPHDSHVLQVLAYAALVGTTTGKTPPYALLRYGQDSLHQIPWDEPNQERLFGAVKEIQQVMANGGAKRNHEREGKCRNCSRRYACDERLI
jgi:CRISPR-associated exonuclease Cas4